MKRSVLALVLASTALTAAHAQAPGVNAIDTVVIIYAENRSFDNLYGHFPGANGLQNVTPDMAVQRDRDGSVLAELPPAWGGLTAKGVTPPITQAQSEHLPNKVFAIDDPNGFNAPLNVTTRDLWHRFYENQMQIDGGKNDKFAAYADAGGLVMGYYDGSKLPLWSVAQKYVLADNFFQGSFGGSFSNHFQLVCACTPYYPDADKSPAKALISVVEPDGVTLTPAPNAPKSALEGPPKFVNSNNLSPDFYAINTMQPPYQPSNNKPAEESDPRFADPKLATTLPPQKEKTIGDLLSDKGVSWAWYAGAWQAALDGKGGAPVPNFQFHHQPFNYFVQYAPGTAARAEHLKDGGMNGEAFLKDIDDGKLPQVTFYKPQGNLNEHAGYTDVESGDKHIADVIAHLEKSPQWGHMLVVITYDENGGFWDHVAPPKADRWGPGSRIPALIVSPFAKKGTVDHTFYDTTSILRFVTKRFDLPVLAGLTARDAALKANGQPALGDLTAALDLPQ
ncbi:acid phosphatase [Microbacteriaceae bacterium K1510]|nr:acid phosphatase [Microbacteriaceae bacterium K1510]